MESTVNPNTTSNLGDGLIQTIALCTMGAAERPFKLDPTSII